MYIFRCIYTHVCTYIYMHTFWVVVHTCHRSPQEAVTGWLIIWGQPKLFRHEDQTLLASNKKKILIWNGANMPTFYVCFSKHDIRGCSPHQYFFYCCDICLGEAAWVCLFKLTAPGEKVRRVEKARRQELPRCAHSQEAERWMPQLHWLSSSLSLGPGHMEWCHPQ